MYTYPPTSVSDEEITELIEKKIKKKDKKVHCGCSSIFAYSFLTCTATLMPVGIAIMISWPEDKAASNFGTALATIGFFAYFCGAYCIMRACASCFDLNDSFLESYFCLFDLDKAAEDTKDRINDAKNCVKECCHPLSQLTGPK